MRVKDSDKSTPTTAAQARSAGKDAGRPPAQAPQQKQQPAAPQTTKTAAVSIGKPPTSTNNTRRPLPDPSGTNTARPTTASNITNTARPTTASNITNTARPTTPAPNITNTARPTTPVPNSTSSTHPGQVNPNAQTNASRPAASASNATNSGRPATPVPNNASSAASSGTRPTTSNPAPNSKRPTTSAGRPTTASNKASSNDELSLVKSQVRAETASRTSLQLSLDALNGVLKDANIDPKKRQMLQDKVVALQRAIKEQDAENAALLNAMDSQSASSPSVSPTSATREMNRIQRIEKEVTFDRNKDEFLAAVDGGSVPVKGTIVKNEQKKEWIGKANMVGASSEVKERLVEKRESGKRLTVVEKVALFADAKSG